MKKIRVSTCSTCPLSYKKVYTLYCPYVGHIINPTIIHPNCSLEDDKSKTRYTFSKNDKIITKG